MLGLYGKLSENLMLFVLVSFIFMSVFGMGIGMEMANGEMSSCPFMADQTTMCQMNVAEHIAKWQEAVTGIPIKLLAFATTLLALAFVGPIKLRAQPKELPAFSARLLAHYKINLGKVFDRLLIAFSSGILKPKIYAPARAGFAYILKNYHEYKITNCSCRYRYSCRRISLPFLWIRV